MKKDGLVLFPMKQDTGRPGMEARLSAFSPLRVVAFLQRHSLSPSQLATVGMLLTIPSLWAGFAQDDFALLANFQGLHGLEELKQPVLDMFTYSEGDVELNRIRMDRGLIPWWSLENWKLSFWRPVASLSHWIDFTLFGDVAWPMHVHSILLYGIIGILEATLYRTFAMTGAVAGLGGLLFMLDAGHAIPVGWLANRNALLSLLFGLLSLMSHHYWRTRSSRQSGWAVWFPGGPLSLLWLALSLLSSEAGVAIGGYYLGYALFLDPAAPCDNGARQSMAGGSRKTRTRGVPFILPQLAVVVIWRLVYSRLGYGVRGCSLYLDPLADPWTSFVNAIQRIPVLLLGLFGLPDSSLWFSLPRSGRIVYSLSAIVLLCAVGWIIWPHIKSNAQRKFYALGALLAVIPFCATMPSDRNLNFASVGAMALIAEFLAAHAGKDALPRASVFRHRAGTVLSHAWVLIHIVISSVLLPFLSWAIVLIHWMSIVSAPSINFEDESQESRYIVVNASMWPSIPLLQSVNGRKVAKHWWWLSTATEPVSLRRIDDRTIRLRVEGGFFPDHGNLFRSLEKHPMQKGFEAQLPGMKVTVIAVDETGRPVEAEFSFEETLDEPSMNWLSWFDGVYEPFTLPGVGDSIRLPGIEPARAIRLKLRATAET